MISSTWKGCANNVTLFLRSWWNTQLVHSRTPPKLSSVLYVYSISSSILNIRIPTLLQAFQNLMTLHILFCTERTMTSDRRVLPTAAFPLELDDEVQYRCAGFIQAAIEQYAEVMEEGAAPDGEEHPSESGESSGEDNVPAKSNKGKGKAKSPVVKGKSVPGSLLITNDLRLHCPEQPLTRSRLEQEYVFMGTISTFLRAIRAGAVSLRHSAVLLAHYGRLGPAFDLCTKVIIDNLREEGMYRDNGDIVVEIVTQALKEVRLTRPFADGR